MKVKRVKKIIAKILTCSMLLSTQVYASPQNVTYDASELTVEATQDFESITFDFESGLDGWEATGDVSVVESGGQDGGKYISMGNGASISRTVTGIPQGSYTLSTWVKGTTSSARIKATNTGGPDSVATIAPHISNDSWQQMGHRNVLVYNGQVTIEIEANSSTILYVDDIELVLDVNDNNPVQNWGFEQELDEWQTQGTVELSNEHKDTGEYGVILSDQSEIYQVIPVEPNTTYFATMRAKVDHQDTYKTINQYGPTGLKMGEIVERTSLGNRVNIGVRTTDGTVLRQAPSGTTDYSLVTIYFETGPNDTEVILYANTIYDEGYRDSITVYDKGEKVLADDWTSNGDNRAYIDNFNVFTLNNHYIKGADVSFLPLLEDLDGKFFANGVQQDCLRILSNHGVNSIITKLFIHSGSPIYHHDTLEQEFISILDENGNPYPRQMQEGYFDKEHTVALAKRATELGMSYMPSFQYSDVWMSNGKAYTPYEWIEEDYEGNLSHATLEMLQTAVYNYVYDILTALREADVDIIGVKHGNEQNDGIMWPTGKGRNSEGHRLLVNASIEASKAVFPGVSNFIHSNNGYNTGMTDAFFGDLIDDGLNIDGMAYSLYGGRYSSMMFDIMENNMAQDRFRYKDYVNVETGNNFTRYNPTPDYDASNIIGQPEYYSTSGNGQYNWLLDYMQAPLDYPNPYGQMRGFYYWETDWLPVMGAGTGIGRNNDVSMRSMFNNGYTGIKEMGSEEPGKVGDMMDSMYAYLMRGYPKDKPESMLTPLKHAGDYTVEQVAPTSITFENSSITLVEGDVERIRPIITPTDQVLTDSEIIWVSSNPSVAIVSELGFVSAVGAGNATITGTVGDVSNTVSVTVHAATKSTSGNLQLEIDGQAIEDGDTVDATIFEKIHLKATIDDKVTDRAVIFKSSDPEVASFFGETWQTPEGQMRQFTDHTEFVQLNVNKGGETTISVETADGGDSLSFTLISTGIPVQSISLNLEEAEIDNGKTLQLVATVVPEDATLYKVHWASSDEEVATVDENGLVTAIKPGETTIRATSDDDSEMYAECKITVNAVGVQKIVLDYTELNIVVGDEKQIQALALPDNTTNKNITWSVDSNDYITVDSDGVVTALAVGGPITVTATAEDGGITAICIVTVQDDEVATTAIQVDPDIYYFKSDYYSEMNPLEDAPEAFFSSQTVPLDATSKGITWESEDLEVASVDSFGRVIANNNGVTTIRATDTDGNEATATVYVPVISESFDNRANGDNWGMTSGSGSMSAKVEDGILNISGSGELFKEFDPIINDKIIIDFIWDVGNSTSSDGSFISFEDSLGNSYVTLKVEDNTLYFGTEGTMTWTLVDPDFKGEDVFYHVNIVMDFVSQTFDLTITNIADTDKTVTHTNNTFSRNVEYMNDFTTLRFGVNGSGELNTSIDDFNIYAGAPIPTAIEVNTTRISLVPIRDTLSASYQLKAEILPDVANQEIEWRSSDNSVATVDGYGRVTATNLVDSLEEIEEGTCTITATSKANPDVSVDIAVKVGLPSNSAEYLDIIDETGEDIAGQTVDVATGDLKTLVARAYGVEGDTEIASAKWEVSDTDVVRIIPQANPLEALVHVIGPGEATVTLTLDCYGSDRIATINFVATGEAVLSLMQLEQALEEAKSAVKYPEGAYVEGCLETFYLAWDNAKEVYNDAITENWQADKQGNVDVAYKALSDAVENLELESDIPVTEIQITELDYSIAIGRSVTLNTAVIPDYATNKEINWSSSNEKVATVSANGEVTAIGTGRATITAEAVNGTEEGVTQTVEIEVTDDLSAWYDYQGGAVSASKEYSSRYAAENALINARTMNYGDPWSAGTTIPSTWTVDLGDVATIDEIYMALWDPTKYTIELSEDGENWETVVDRTELTGDKIEGGSGNGRYGVTEQLPAGSVGRYIRVTVNGLTSGKWSGILIFQAKGSFGEVSDEPGEIGLEIIDPGYPISLGKAVQLETVITPNGATADLEIEWTSSDQSVATVNKDGKVRAIGTGTAVIEATLKGSDAAATIEIEVTDDLSSWYNYQGGTVSANKTNGSNVPANPLINARTMAYRGTAWSPGRDFPATWTVDLGDMATIEEIYIAAWQPQKYTIELSEDGEVWETIIDRSEDFYGEEFDALKPSDGSTGTRYQVAEELTEDNVARYIRVTLEDAANAQWGSMEVFQAKGSFIEEPEEPAEVDIEIIDPGYPISLSKEVQLETVITSEGDTTDLEIEWTSSDEDVATVDEAGKVHAVGVGEVEIKATVVDREAEASIKIEVTKDLSSYYDYQGGDVSADKTSGSHVAKNPLINARTMAYRGTAWSPARSFPATWTVDLGEIATIEEIYIAAWAPQKYTIELSEDIEDEEGWVTIVDRRDDFYGEAFEAHRPSDDSYGTRYRITEELIEDNVGRYIRVTIFDATGSDYGSMEVFQANGRFAELEEISITESPDNTSYIEGEYFDPTGMEVTAYYSDGTSEVITNYTIEPDRALELDDEEVIISYGGQSIAVEITVTEDTDEEVTLEKIEITKQPDKTEYKVGETFDATGMEVTAYYSDESHEVVIEYTIEPDRVLELTDTTVTITYKDQSVEVEITVEEEDEIVVELEIIGPDYPISLGKEVQLETVIKPADAAVDSVVRWTSSDVTIATVDGSGKVHAVGVGTVTIKATVESSDATATIEIEITEDISSWYDYQGGAVSASVTQEGHAKNPLINARTMSYRDSGWSPGTSFPATWEVDLGELATIDEIYMVTQEPQKYKIDLSEDGQAWETVVDRSDNFHGELFETFTLSDTTTGSSYRVTETLPKNNTTRYVRVTILEAIDNKPGSLNIFQAKGSFLGEDEPDEGVTLKGISITNQPVKTTYIEGETFDPTGMEVTAYYSDGSTEVITDYTIDPNGALESTDNKVTIGYNGHTAKVKITVEEEPEEEVILEEIRITKQPNKTRYTVGQRFNSAGMEVMAYYSDGSSEVITDYTIDIDRPLRTTDTKVGISYGGYTVEVSIRVVRKDNDNSNNSNNSNNNDNDNDNDNDNEEDLGLQESIEQRQEKTTNWAREQVDAVNNLPQEERDAKVAEVIDEIPYIYNADEVTDEAKELLQSIGVDIETISIATGKDTSREGDIVTFEDVSEAHWAYDSVEWAYQEGYLNGHSDNTARLSESLRADDTMIFLGRFMAANGGIDVVQPRSVVESYVDVDGSHSSYEKAYLASGLSTDTLDKLAELENEEMPRELLAQMVYEITGGNLPIKAESKEFNDIADSPYKEAMEYCVMTGILNGVSEDMMAPGKAITRAEMLTILKRLED